MSKDPTDKKNLGAKPLPFTFNGVEQPNYTQIPNFILDKVIPHLSGPETKVLLYIMRRTFGFLKDADRISLNQMVNGIIKSDGTVLDYGTGLNKSTVIRALKVLIDKKIIGVEKTNSALKGHEINNYKLVFEFDPSSEAHGQNIDNNPIKEEATNTLVAESDKGLVAESDNPLVAESDKGLVAESDKPLVAESDIQKKVIQKKEQQKKERQKKATTTKFDPKESNKKAVVVALLVDFGITSNVAERLASEKDHQYLRQKFDYAQYLLEQSPQKITSPKGWLVKAIEQDFAAPDGFISQDDLAVQAAHEELESQRQAALDQRAAKKQIKIAQLEREKYQQWRSALNQTYGTTENDFALWKLALVHLKTAFVGNQRTYQDVVAKAEILRVDEQNVWLGVETKFALDRMNHRNHILFEREFTYILQKPVKVEFIVVGTPDIGVEDVGSERTGKVNGRY